MASSQLPRMRPKIANQPRRNARSVSDTAATIQNATSTGVHVKAGSCRLGSVSLIVSPNMAPKSAAAAGAT